jgi:hypothetical protein
MKGENMQLLSTSEIAKKRGLSTGRIRQIAPEIKGAIKTSAGWIFPVECLDDPIFKRKVGRPKKGDK